MDTMTAEKMAKSKGDSPVRIDPEVLKLARVVVAFQDVSLTDYLSGILRPVVEADYARHVKEAAKRQGDPKPKR